MAKTFTLKVPTSHTPFYALLHPLRPISESVRIFLRSEMPQNSVEKSANGILYSIPGRPCSKIRATLKNTFVLLCYGFGGKNPNSVSARLMATAAGKIDTK